MNDLVERLAATSPTNALAAERIADKRGHARGTARWLEVRDCALQEIAAAEERGRHAGLAAARALLGGTAPDFTPIQPDDGEAA